jgi:hypothetical protein
VAFKKIDWHIATLYVSLYKLFAIYNFVTVQPVNSIYPWNQRKSSALFGGMVLFNVI